MRRKDDVDYFVETLMDAIGDAEGRGVDTSAHDELSNVLEDTIRAEWNKPRPPTNNQPNEGEL